MRASFEQLKALLTRPAPRLPSVTPSAPFSVSLARPVRSYHYLTAFLADLSPLPDASVFGFVDGPPVHDPLCIAYLLSGTHPNLFKGKRYRVDVELAGQHTAGTTVVDLYNYREKELTAMSGESVAALLWGSYTGLNADLPSPTSDPESRESWGRLGKNVWVAEQVDVRAFWDLFQQVSTL